MSELRHHFGFRSEPFAHNVPVSDLYPLPALEPLQQRVIFTLQQKAISVITGDVGSGKSTSLRYVTSKLHASEYHLIPLVGGVLSVMELYRQILLHFGVHNHSYQISVMIARIRELLLEIASRNVVPVLVIDEAHLLKRSVFTQLHTLAQFEFDSKPIMPMILCGQELLLEHLMAAAVRPLASRVLGRSNLESIRLEVMQEYVNHHIRIAAGIPKKLFSEEALFAIHQGSGGLLRKANSLAKTALLACAGDGVQTVSPEHVRIASTEIFL